jgi:SAM-dependent methyltransferase
MRNAEQKWDKKARTFPRYKENPDEFEAKVLKLMNETGVRLDGLKLLDVGCGTGKFTIHLAKSAKEVTGTDISSEMLKLLNEDAEKAGVKNIKTVHTTWEDFDITSEAFDAVFCSTTPAVTTEADFEKVNNAASKLVIYLGWAGRKESSIMNPLYEKYGIDFQKIDDVALIKKWLSKKEISYRNHIIDDTWERSFAYDDIKRQVIENMESYNANWKEEDIDDVLRRQKQTNGRVVEKTYVLLELIVWEK